MKRFIVILICVTSAIICRGQQTNSMIISQHIAQKMKDTLQLSTAQQEQVYRINAELQQQKMSARINYPVRDSLQRKIQGIEKTRDALYKRILRESQYQLYRKKKSSLISIN